jgi:hypothetical protein
LLDWNTLEILVFWNFQPINYFLALLLQHFLKQLFFSILFIHLQSIIILAAFVLNNHIYTKFDLDIIKILHNYFIINFLCINYYLNLQPLIINLLKIIVHYLRFCIKIFKSPVFSGIIFILLCYTHRHKYL